MRLYYDSEGNMNEQAFAERLAELHNEIANGDLGTLDELLAMRRKLYSLKYKYELCGRHFLECEYEIMALNEIIAEMRA